MKKGWQTKKLGEICEIDKSQGIHRGLPYVGLEHIESHTARFIGDAAPQTVKSSTFRFTPHHVLYGRLRPYLNKALAPDFNGHCSTEIFPLKPSASITRDYLLYWLLADETLERINGTCTGARMPRADMNEVMGFDIPLPPRPEQKRIVGILDEAFAGIAAAKATAEQNFQNARALFESHLNAVFTQRNKGWVEMTLGEACILRSGTTLPKAIERPAGEIPYLKVADMNLSENLNGVTASSRYVNKRDVNASNLLPVGTTIFPKRGGAILTNKKRLTHRVICADLNIMGVTPKSGLLPEFLFNFFRRLDLREINNGSSIPQINNYSIEPLAIAFPKSTAEQKAIVAALDALSAETARISAHYARKLELLEELKKSLLHRAFAGKL